MIEVKSATFQTYSGRKVTMDFYMALFRAPLWKVKELLLDKLARPNSADPIVKVVSLNYRQLGQ